jgi:hypothetical protein
MTAEQSGNSLLLVLLGPEGSPDKRAALVGAFEDNTETWPPVLPLRPAESVQENCQWRDSVLVPETLDKGVVNRVDAAPALLNSLDAQVVRITRRYEAHLPAPPVRST